MVNKLICSSFILMLLATCVLAQEDETVVKVKGEVVDAETGEAVIASIYYESLPYGNKVGVFTDASFVFKMEDRKDYAISAKAQGYSNARVTVSPDSANAEGIVNAKIVLEQNSVGRVMRLETLIFARGDKKIPGVAYPELNALVQALKESPTMVIQLEGHTDYRGDAKKNMNLSEERVEATKDYLVKQGVHKKRILVKAFGGTKPLKRSNDPDSYRHNRRVEVRVISN